MDAMEHRHREQAATAEAAFGLSFGTPAQPLPAPRPSVPLPAPPWDKGETFQPCISELSGICRCRGAQSGASTRKSRIRLYLKTDGWNWCLHF